MTARPSAGASRRERTFDVTTPGDGYGQQGQQGWQQSYGDQGGNPPGWGQPATPPKPRNGMGTAALVFGILALLAVILGSIGRGRVKSLQATNGGAATTGLVLGVIMLILGVITQILVIFFAVAFLNFGGANSLQQLQDCVNNANNQPNPAAVQQAYEQCGQQFGQQLPGSQPEGEGG